ncbi:MAG: hypothetical protein ACOY3P_04580 [Planctomycetota bacterium]
MPDLDAPQQSAPEINEAVVEATPWFPPAPTNTIAESTPSAPDESTAGTPPAELPETGSPLIPIDAYVARSENLEQIASQADRHIRHGMELAGRRAVFAARAEFITALRLLAQGLDADRQTTTHSRALAAGLTALDEAENFIPTGGRLEADLDVAAIIGSHRTPVLKGIDPTTLTPMGAMKQYFTFAQEQLAAGAGREIAGSMALSSLGKLHTALATERLTRELALESKAITYYQAALMVFPENVMAANDMAVLLARCGNFADARMLLEHSVALAGQAASWHNLAIVYEQLQMRDAAAHARAQAMASTQTQKTRVATKGRGPGIQWLDPRSFAQTSSEVPAPRPMATQRPASSRPASPASPAPGASMAMRATHAGRAADGTAAANPPTNESISRSTR